jgi:serine/threonine protein phosphatase 1
MLVQKFPKNFAGRDFAVGDIHGFFSRLRQALDAINFDPLVDRLFSVGDLVDRGPECLDVLAFLDQPWFHAVCGNHEDYACRYETVDEINWLRNGGAWFMDLPQSQQAEISARLKALPICMEIEAQPGTIGIVHADVAFNDWNKTLMNLGNRTVRDFCLWSRRRVHSGDDTWVTGIRAVVVGHNALKKACVLGNVYHIDTAGWRPDENGYFTLLNLNTLEACPPIEEHISGLIEGNTTEKQKL